MLQKVISNALVLALAGATVLWTAEPSQAAPHGGAHIGGAHIGGTHFGGARIGGAHIGGFNGGFSHGGIHRGFGYHPNYSYRRYSPNYRSYGSSSYPYYYSYPYQSYYPDSGSYGDSSYDPDAGALPPDSALQPSDPDADVPAAPAESSPEQNDTRAYLTVRVPANAEIWVAGTKMTSTGFVREFQSPPLTPGKHYAYEVRARWDADGNEVAQTQQVPVAAGAHVTVNFPAP